MRNLLLAFILPALLTLSACKKPGKGDGGASASSKAITSFSIKVADNPGLTADIQGTIAGDTILLSVANGVNVSSLKPAIQHTGASITPLAGVARNFNFPVTYTVKAVDNSVHNYTVVIRTTVNNTVFVASNDDKLYAINGDNGALKWSYTTGGSLLGSTPTYYNGTVYIGSGDRNLYALDAATGALKWKLLCRGSLAGSTLNQYNGRIYFGSASSFAPSQTTHAVDATTGVLIWERVEGSYPTTICVTNNILYITSVNGLYSCNANTGVGLVNFVNGDICRDNPLVVNGILYTGHENRLLIAFNAINASVLWQNTDGFGTRCGPTLKNGAIYNGDQWRMRSFDSASGSSRWVYPTGTTPANGIFSAPSVENDIVYAGNSDNSVTAIGAGSGTLLWKFVSNVSPGGGSSGWSNNVTVVDKMVYFGCYDKYVYGLNALDGTVRWKFLTGGEVFGGACVVADNQVVYHAGLSGEKN